jgi:hypothetical protein
MAVLTVDWDKSERGPQRRRAQDGRLLHCCCVCGRLDLWGSGWSMYCSEKEIDDGKPIPKFCSEACRAQGGARAERITEEMKRGGREAEWREPDLVYRTMTDQEKYLDAAAKQRRPGRSIAEEHK